MFASRKCGETVLLVTQEGKNDTSLLVQEIERLGSLCAQNFLCLLVTAKLKSCIGEEEGFTNRAQSVRDVTRTALAAGLMMGSVRRISISGCLDKVHFL